MSFLLDLIRTLDKDELVKLRSLPVKGREEEVFEKTIKHRNDKEDVDAKIQTELELTKSHFDKINSVLLRKCYEHFTDGTNEKIFNFLFDKQLIELLYHEIKIREKGLLKTGDKAALKLFYWNSLFQLRRQAVQHFDKKLIVEYANKYLATLSKPTLEDEGEVCLMLESVFVFYYAVMGEGPKYEPVFLKKISEWEQKLKGKKYHRANFQLLLSMANYYDFYTSDTRIAETLEQALIEFDLAKGAIPEGLKTYAAAKLAKAYCQCSRFEESMKMYQQCFEQWGPELRKNYYHMLMYSVIAIINHRFVEAQEMLDVYLMPKLLISKNAGMQFNTNRNYAILHMHKGEYKEALEHIHLYMQLPRTETDLLGDILNRLVHNAYFIIIGELDTALNLIEKNKKFLRAKVKLFPVKEYDDYFTTMREIVKHKWGAKLPKGFNERLQGYQQGIMKLYGDLLVKMLQRN